VEQLLERFGSVTEKEVEEVCDLPGPRAGAELYGLAERWRVRRRPCLNGAIFEAP
jgi:hypothetical protein